MCCPHLFTTFAVLTSHFQFVLSVGSKNPRPTAVKFPRIGSIGLRIAIWLMSAKPVSLKWLRPWLNDELSVQVGEIDPLYRNA